MGFMTRTIVVVAIAGSGGFPTLLGGPTQTLGTVAIYPGAHPRSEQKAESDHRATLTLADGLHVARAAAETYTTDASAPAVLAFYRHELQRLGTVTECRDGENRASSVRLVEASVNDATVCQPAEFGEGDTELKAARDGELAIVTVRGTAQACEFAVIDVQASRTGKP